MAYLIFLRAAGSFVQPPAGQRLDRPAIPKRIIQYWSSDKPQTDYDVIRLMDEWRAMNPGCEYLRFNEKDATHYLAREHPPHVLRAFLRVRDGAQKADIFRLAYLSKFGGVYVDADNRCLNPIASLIEDGNEIFCYQEYLGSIGNDFLAAAPGSKLLGDALSLCTTAVLRGDQDMIWLMTGPGLLSRVMALHFARSALVETLPDRNVTILDRQVVARYCCVDSTLSYKRTNRGWLRKAFARDEHASTITDDL